MHECCKSRPIARGSALTNALVHATNAIHSGSAPHICIAKQLAAAECRAESSAGKKTAPHIASSLAGAPMDGNGERGTAITVRHALSVATEVLNASPAHAWQCEKWACCELRLAGRLGRATSNNANIYRALHLTGHGNWDRRAALGLASASAALRASAAALRAVSHASAGSRREDPRLQQSTDH